MARTANTPTMRVFLAVDLPPATKQQLETWRANCSAAPARAVPAHQFHLTLAFIAALPTRQLESLVDAVDAWHQQQPRDALDVRLRLDQMGYWPKPGIIWAGPSAVQHSLLQLAQAMMRIARKHGAAMDRRPYTPHVTLYRTAYYPPAAPTSPPDICFAADEFSLFESVLAPKGVHYRRIAGWPLEAQ